MWCTTRISQDTGATAMWKVGTLILALCAFWNCRVGAAAIQQNAVGCTARGTPVYSVVFKGEWTKSRFPKQYPRRRPPAQWSTLVGRVHNSEHTMWAKGQLATPGVRLFAEEGKTVWLLNEGKFTEHVHAQFTAPRVGRGVGHTTANITVNSEYPMVSLMVRLKPSPDWFAGVNSLNLCEGGRWKDEVHVDMNPWDAGTDAGLTFSSPSYSERRQHRIAMITSKFPNHPASSFYYPRRPHLPRIAETVFIKLTPDPTTPEPTTLPPTTTTTTTTMATTTLPPTTMATTTTTMATTTLPPTTTTTMRTTTPSPTTTTEGTTQEMTTTPEVTTTQEVMTTQEMTTPELTTPDVTTTTEAIMTETSTQMMTTMETTALETTWGPSTTLKPLLTTRGILTTTPEDVYHPMVVDVGVKTWEGDVKEEETTKHKITAELTKEDFIPTKKEEKDPKYSLISSAEKEDEGDKLPKSGLDSEGFLVGTKENSIEITDTGSGVNPQADEQRDSEADNRPIALPIRRPSGYPSADKKGDLHVGSKGKENIPKFSSREEDRYPPFMLKSVDGTLSGDKVERSDMPVNCAVSDWSPWGQCSTTCGLGIKRATRWVTQAPENGGEPCPALLREGICINDPCPGVEMCLFDCNSRYNYRFIPYRRKYGQEP